MTKKKRPRKPKQPSRKKKKLAGKSGLSEVEVDRLVPILFNKWKCSLFAKNPHLMAIGQMREIEQRHLIRDQLASLSSARDLARHRKMLK